MEEQEFNEGHLSEAGDRCHVVMSLIQEILYKHPAIIKLKQEQRLDKVMELLSGIYGTCWAAVDDLEGQKDVQNKAP